MNVQYRPGVALESILWKRTYLPLTTAKALYSYKSSVYGRHESIPRKVHLYLIRKRGVYTYYETRKTCYTDVECHLTRSETEQCERDRFPETSSLYLSDFIIIASNV